MLVHGPLVSMFQRIRMALIVLPVQVCRVFLYSRFAYAYYVTNR